MNRLARPEPIDMDTLHSVLGGTTQNSGYRHTTDASTSQDGDHYSNVAVGLDGNDTIKGHGGDDMLSGNVGNDSLLGGDGHDSVNGDSGQDTLNGGHGNDLLNGGSENDLVIGDMGNDELIGGSGDDTLRGGVGDDEMTGGAGNDVFDQVTGNDSAYGGGGNDVFRISNSDPGDKEFHGSSGHDTVEVGGTGLQPGGGFTELEQSAFRIECDTPYTLIDGVLTFEGPASGEIRFVSPEGDQRGGTLTFTGVESVKFVR